MSQNTVQSATATVRSLPAQPATLIEADAILRAQTGVSLRRVRTNLRRAHGSATPRQHAYGLRWYAEARVIGEAMDSAYGLPAGMGACLIAALSPRTKWADNVRMAWAAAFLTGDAGTDTFLNSRPNGCMPMNWTRAQNVVVAGMAAHAESEFGWAPNGPVWDVMHRALGNGPKVAAFARNVRDGGYGAGVTIDVWAARAAFIGTTWARGFDMSSIERDLGRKGVYAALEMAYAAEARRVGVSPAVFQAAVWCAVAGYEG